MQNNINNKKVLKVRKHSFNILYDTFFNDKKLTDCIDSTFNDYDIKEEDKAYINREVNGVIEKLTDIDKYINKISKLKVNKLDKDILIVLRIGIYELLFMDKVPEYATINECVNLVKSSKNKHLSSYVNGVLRSVQRFNLKGTVKNIENKSCYFRGFNGCDNFSFDYIDYDGDLKFWNLKVYKAKKYSDIVNSQEFIDGKIMIQDASSAYLTDTLSYYIKEREKEIKEKFENDTISMIKLLDTCAAPGGKILGLIDLIYSDYYYFYAEAWDVTKEKVLKICENINRLKILDLNMQVMDASKYYSEYDKKYDVVICDVPCSGLGVIGKKPDIKLRFTKEKLVRLVELQRKILFSSSNYVKDGGLLSYSTCTTTKEENEDMVNEFISKNKDFEKFYEKKIMPNDGSKCDGFYFCIMKRK